MNGPVASMQKRNRFVKLPAGWRPVRRSGSLLYDVLLPAVFLLFGLLTLGLVLLAVGVLVGVISYK